MSPLRRSPSRVPTTFAVGFLSLDALLLVYAGIAAQRPVLTTGGVVCALLIPAVVLLWRRHRRDIFEIETSRRSMRDEALAIRQLLKQQHVDN